MKRTVFYLVALLLLFSCGGKNSYIIEGRYKAAPDGTVLYLTAFDDILSVVDSAVVENGRFGFSGVCDTLSVCYLSSLQVIDGGYVVLEPGEISFVFGRGTVCGGTSSNDALTRFMNEKERLLNLRMMTSPAVASKMNLDQAMLDSLRALGGMAENVFAAYTTKLIKENVDNPLGCFYFVQSAGVLPGKIAERASALVQEKFRGKQYEAKMRQLENESDLRSYANGAELGAMATAVGKKYQNFELRDIRGNSVLMSDRLASSKYALLLFWAGWNDESINEMALLKELYGKYKGKGLDIVAVSLDKSVELCASSADRLGLSWLQLCDPDGGCSELAVAYGVSALPVMLLINNEGTIIMRATSADDVRVKLEEIF
jgi:peroxiredoxin